MKYANEKQLVARFRELFPGSQGCVRGWCDEDAALVDGLPGQTVSCLDTLVEGVHFRLDWGNVDDLGYKAVAVNYSDLASCGATPLYIMLGLSAPTSFLESHLESFYAGLNAALAEWGGAFAGGDYTRSNSVVVTVAAVGILQQGERFWSRSGCLPGERLYLSGVPGLADRQLADLLAGRKNEGKQLTRPTPGLAVSSRLRTDRIPVGGCCDTSDSLSSALHLLADASGCGIRLDRRAVMAIPGVGEGNAALYGGEDFDLLFSSSAEIDCSRFMRESGVMLTEIGEVVPGSGVRDTSGTAVDSGGYDHLG